MSWQSAATTCTVMHRVVVTSCSTQERGEPTKAKAVGPHSTYKARMLHPPSWKLIARLRSANDNTTTNSGTRSSKEKEKLQKCQEQELTDVSKRRRRKAITAVTVGITHITFTNSSAHSTLAVCKMLPNAEVLCVLSDLGSLSGGSRRYPEH